MDWRAKLKYPVTLKGWEKVTLHEWETLKGFEIEEF